MPDYNALQKLENQVKSIGTPLQGYNAYPTLSTSDISSGGRYPVFHLGLNNEDIYGRNQGTMEKWGNGAVKFLGNLGTTVVSGTVGLVNGLVQWKNDGKFSSFYDNDFTRGLDDFNKNLENTNPNYYSDKEKNASILSSDTWGTANFWSDTVFKNLGFAAGAYLSGAAWSKAFSLIGNVAKATTGGGLLDMANSAKTAESASLLTRTSSAFDEGYTALSKVASRYIQKDKLMNFGGQAVRAGMASFGEASMEALQAKRAYQDRLIAEYKDKTGADPSPEILEEISGQADKVSNFTFGANVALLTGTNYIQFPRIAGMFWKADKAALTSAERGIGEIALNNGTFSAVKKGVTGRVLDKFKAYGGLVFSPSEAFEEGAQFVIPYSAEDYFNKGRQGQETNAMTSLLNGLKEVVTNKEGQLAILSGGISGGMMQNFSPFGGVKRMFGSIREPNRVRQNTNSFVNALNSTFLDNYLPAANESLKRGEVLNEEAYQALRAGDRLQYEDVRHDSILNWMLPRIQYGRFDLVKDDIQGYRDLAATQDGFNELVKNGLATEDMTQQEFINNMSKLESLATTTRDQFEALNSRYGGIQNADGTPKYNNQSLMAMAYTASKIDDYNKRIPDLLQDFNAAKIGVAAYMDKVMNNTITNEDIEQLADNINSIKGLSPELKSDLITKAGDLLELSARRELKIQEYEEIQKRPELYQSFDSPSVDTTPEGEPNLNKVNEDNIEPEIPLDDKQLAQMIATKIVNGEELTEQEQAHQAKYPKLFEELLNQMPSLNDRKQEFVDANEGRNFTMEVNGRPQTGTLSLQDGKLYLNYGDLSTEVTNTDIQNGTLTSEEAAEDPGGYLLLNDPRSEITPQNRLISATKEAIDLTEKRLKENLERIDLRTKEIESITQEIRNEGTVRYFTRDMVSDMTTLIEMRQEMMEEVEALQIENEDLQNVITQYQQTIDNPPASARHQIDLLKAQLVDLQDLSVSNGLIQGALDRLINSSTDLLSRLGKKVMSRAMSWKRNLANSPAFTSIQRSLEAWEQSQDPQDLQAALNIIQQETELITNLDNRPLSPGEVKWISDKYEEVSNRLKEVEDLSRAKQEFIDNLQEVQEDIDTRQELFLENVPENFVEEEDVAPGPTETEEPVPEVPPNGGIPVEVPTEEAFPEDGDKIPLNRLFDSTYLPPENMRDQTWYSRLNNFINKLGTFPQEKRASLRLVTVTKASEAAQGLTGLVDKYNTNNKGEPYIPLDTNDAPVTLVMQQVNEDGSRSFLNEKGEVVDGKDLNELVITKMRAASLTWTNGQTSYSRATPEEAEQKLREFEVERATLVNSPVAQEYRFRTAGGRVSTRDKVPIVGNLVTDEVARTKKVLKIVSREGVKGDRRRIQDPDGNSIVAKIGSIIIESEDAFQQVYTRPLSDKDYKIIKGTLSHIAKVVKDSPTGPAEAKVTQLVNFLHGTANIKLGGDNYSTVVVGGTKNTLSTEKVDNPSYEAALRTNITETNVNRELLKDNKQFTEVTGFESDGTPLLRVWSSYQEYLLSTEGNRQPLVDAYKKTDKYLVMSKDIGSQTRRTEEQPAKAKAPKPTKDDLVPGDKIVYENQPVNTPAGKRINVTGNFTVLITKSSGLDTFVDQKGTKVLIPKGANVVRENGTNDIFYLAASSHNKSGNKKSYKTSFTEPQVFEVEDVLPSSDEVMEEVAEIPTEVVATNVNEANSVKTGTATDLKVGRSVTKLTDITNRIVKGNLNHQEVKNLVSEEKYKAFRQWVRENTPDLKGSAVTYLADLAENNRLQLDSLIKSYNEASKERPEIKNIPKEVVQKTSQTVTSTLEIGDEVSFPTRSGNTETYKVLRLSGSNYILEKTLTNPAGELISQDEIKSTLTKDDPFGKKTRFPSEIGRRFLESKQQPQITLPEIVPNCS